MILAESSACGVGFVASLTAEPSHGVLQAALRALRSMEHRGACGPDGVTGDGAGVMTDIPFELLGVEPGTVAIATLFLTSEAERAARAFDAFAQTNEFFGIQVLGAREVPVDPSALGPVARATMPRIVQVMLKRPPQCRTERSFEALLYTAKQLGRGKLKASGGWLDVFFPSYSTRTIVYKALCRGADLDRFYLDLTDPRFVTRFAVLHRRFSTNTRSTWDKVQPMRRLAHNGEINTVAANRSMAYSREAALGLAADELLTHAEISDSGSLNEMIEALRSRSSIPRLDDIMAILIPPAGAKSGFYRFWGRAMEPWDGPALVAFGDGETVGARLDRNGFRPARWCRTADAFHLSSEAGAFALDEAEIVEKGTLHAGSGVTIELATGEVQLRDPSEARENAGAVFDARLVPLAGLAGREAPTCGLDRVALFGLDDEEIERVLAPMIATGREPIGSMGDTARIAVLSDEPRSFYDFFYQDFAQVTNPPLDYLREAMVTDLEVYIGARPNIFAPRELIPPPPAISHEGAVLSLAELATLLERAPALHIPVATIDCTFERAAGADGLRDALRRIGEQVIARVQEGCAIVVLSQREASVQRPPVPSLLAVRAAVGDLNQSGVRLSTSVVLDAGDIHTTHQLACAISFGATVVCPFVALSLARAGTHPHLPARDPGDAERRLIAALHGGLLKIMSKMGISIVRSYHSSKLFTAVGIGPGLMDAYFHGIASPVGGIELEHVAARVIALAERAAALPPGAALPDAYRFKEKVKGGAGERHAMTAARSKLVHDLVRGRSQDPDATWQAYLRHGDEAAPISVRHLLALQPAERATPLADVEPDSMILARFGAGAMSFGAISAEAQRDLFIAMRTLGARCNSGEGGENPYYFVDGTSATTKQVASARFGVTAEYLAAAEEFEIKIAQGAKPGEGGQLMGVKVDEHIARARHARPGVDLISPPPLHDVYSIEDLKQLVYELEQVKPGTAVCVKLVAGANVGVIAVGVAKAGASIIQISGGDGGTGAASLSSMKHAGLPWELGLVEVHRALVHHGVRDRVTLRVDGGFATAEDVLVAALLGAEEYGFGKLLLVAEGCIMARICEKNRCPTGIATHDPKFKSKYKGSPEHVMALLRRIAGDVRTLVASLGARSLGELVGQGRHLRLHPDHAALARDRGLDLDALLSEVPWTPGPAQRSAAGLGPLNRRIVSDCAPTLEADVPVQLGYAITPADRAVPTGLCGRLALRSHQRRMAALRSGAAAGRDDDFGVPPGTVRIAMEGSAGQGFCAFLVGGIDVELRGEANDSVCKSMSGGRVVIRPDARARFVADDQVIVGNAALYGATGGTVFVHGRAGDRFAVRNSGAVAVVAGAGLHACEYMTGGTVVILGPISHNAGAGMTGGVLYLLRDQVARIHGGYVHARELVGDDVVELRALVTAYATATESSRATALLADPETLAAAFVRVEPRTGG